MTSNYLLTFFFAFLMHSCGIKSEEKALNKSPQQEYVLQSDPVIVGCGNIFFAYGFRFKEASKDSTVIVGIVRCPDDYGEGFFKTGEKYILKYTTEHIADSVKNYSLQNPYEEYHLPTYFITEINKSK